MQTGTPRIRLDDRGQLRASVDCLDNDRLASYKRERTKDRDFNAALFAPFILPGMGRVTTDPNSDKFGALVHVSDRGDGTFLEQWMLEDPPAPTPTASSAVAPVTINFGTTYEFQGTPERYPRRLPWLRPDVPIVPTAWMALAGGTGVTKGEFFSAAVLRTQARYAYAVITKDQIAKGAWPTVPEEHVPHGATHGLRWEEWLQNPQSAGKAWVYGEWAETQATYVQRTIHMAWSADTSEYEPVPGKDSHSEANPSNSMHLAAWVQSLPDRFPGSYYYVRGVVRLYANANALGTTVWQA
jgi:hypothetical protein